MLDPTETERLLDKLCVDLGFCLPPVEYERIAEEPPADVRAFVDAVFLAERLDPTTADRHLYRTARDVVMKAFRDAEKRRRTGQ